MPAEADVVEDAGERRRKAVIGLLVLAALVALVVWWLLAQLITVPGLVGLSQKDAEARLKDAGLRYSGAVIVDATEGETPGTVVQQVPAEGDRVPKGSKVTLSVAAEPGVQPRSQPSTAGAGLLDESYLDLPEEGRDVDDVGLVPESPPVSSGPQVPLVLDKTLSSARSALEAAGYGVAVRRRPSTTSIPAGIVIRQDPAPDAYEPRGTVVTVWVSTGHP